MALKASRRGGVPPFIVMDVLRAANALEAAGRSVMHLEVGQPSTPAPRGVIAAARRALDEDRLGYTEAFGLPVLRERIARHYREFYGVAVDARRVVACTGSSGGFVLAFLAAFDAGDRVALAVPGYPAYRNTLAALGIEPVLLEAGPETHFQPTPEILARVSGRLDGLIVASPADPTGTMVARAEFARLAAYCRERGIRLISDEIYHGIAYGAAADTALAFDSEAIVVNSFSKYFSMTGWRMGWMVVPILAARGRMPGAEFLSRRRRCRSSPRPPPRLGRGLEANVAATRKTGGFCCRSCPAPGSTPSRRPTACSIFMPTSAG